MAFNRADQIDDDTGCMRIITEEHSIIHDGLMYTVDLKGLAVANDGPD